MLSLIQREGHIDRAILHGALSVSGSAICEPWSQVMDLRRLLSTFRAAGTRTASPC